MTDAIEAGARATITDAAVRNSLNTYNIIRLGGGLPEYAMRRAIEAAIALVPAGADNTTLHSVISDIREKSGVGAKPMLSELADAIAASKASAVAEMRERCAKHISGARIKIANGGLESIPLRQWLLTDGLKELADEVRQLDLSPACGEYVVVPREPTEAMIEAAFREPDADWHHDVCELASEWKDDMRRLYRAMLHATTRTGSGK